MVPCSLSTCQATHVRGEDTSMSIDIQAIKAANPLEAVIERFANQRVEKHKIFAPWRNEETPSVIMPWLTRPVELVKR